MALLLRVAGFARRQAIILGLVNAIVRPVLKVLSCPLIILTLGLFIFVINALTLWLASGIAVKWFHVGFYVEGFAPAFLGSLVVSISVWACATRRPAM